MLYMMKLGKFDYVGEMNTYAKLVARVRVTKHVIVMKKSLP